MNTHAKKLILFVTLGVMMLMISCSRSTEWQPAGDTIRTRWAADIRPDNVLPDYPRMQLQRKEWQHLNGLWDYAIVPQTAEQPSAYDGKILVPFALESSLSGVGRTLSQDSVLWYHRTFRVPSSWRKQRVMLHFGAVDWEAEVFVNGQPAGSHRGGYTPFSLDITDLISGRGKQELTVRVSDPCDAGFSPRGKQVSRPEGIWYTSVSGIWQTVWMEPVAENHITALRILPDVDNSMLRVWPLTSLASGEVEVQVTLGGKDVAKGSAAAGEPIDLTISDMQLWSPQQPVLYALTIRLTEDGRSVDEAASYAAMRKISVGRTADGHKRMMLNDKPLFQFGPLDQGWWPDGLYTAPTDEALRFDIEKTKEYGFNMIRKHVKVEPDRWYYWCDKLGVLVWQDMPSGDLNGQQWDYMQMDGGKDADRSEESKDNYLKEWGEIMDFGYSHPCIVVWVPFNEAWGQFETERIAEWTKQRDPSRLVNSASGGNFRRCGDILDLHNYPHPDMRLTDTSRVFVQGEYGGIGRVVDGHTWWQNDRNWGYIRFASEEEVTAEYEKYARLYFQFIPEGCSAAVYTQTTDVEGEVNGLMTYDRAVMKLNVDSVRAINEAVIAALK